MASAAMRMSSAMDYPDATCDPVASATLRVYPPNQTVAQSVPFASTGCGSAAVKLLQINAVSQGRETRLARTSSSGPQEARAHSCLIDQPR
jgi:hypothetical protein